MPKSILGDFGGGKVPTPRPAAQLQVPQAKGTADIILAFEELRSQDLARQQQERLKAADAIDGAMRFVAEMSMKRRDQELQRMKDEATIELLKASSRRDEDKLRLARSEEARAAELAPLKMESERALAEARKAAGRGVTFFDPVTGESISMPKGARPLTVAGAQEARRSAQQLEGLKNTLARLKSALDAAPAGPVVGRLAQFGTNLNILPESVQERVQSVTTITSTLIPLIPRVLNKEVGNLNEFEQKRAADAIAGLTGSRAQQRAAMRELIELTEIAISRSRESAKSVFDRAGGGEAGGLMRRRARPKGAKEYRNYISTDGGKTWRAE